MSAVATNADQRGWKPSISALVAASPEAIPPVVGDARSTRHGGVGS
jgi:hypothetical protein